MKKYISNFMTGESISIALLSNKGGTGKTTTAIHLAHCAQQDNFQVLTVDCDRRNYTLSTWYEKNQELNEKKRVRFKCTTYEEWDGDTNSDLIFYDLQGGSDVDLMLEKAESADLTILVTKPYEYDLNSAFQSVAEFNPNVNYKILLTQAAIASPEIKDAKAILKEADYPFFHQSIRSAVAFSRHCGNQSTVASLISQSSQRVCFFDYKELYKEILQELGIE